MDEMAEKTAGLRPAPRWRGTDPPDLPRHEGSLVRDPSGGVGAEPPRSHPLTRYRRNGRVASRTLDGRACLMHPGLSELTVLNESGTLLWDALAVPLTAAELADRLEAAFEVDRATALADAREFAARLAALDLLKADES